MSRFALALLVIVALAAGTARAQTAPRSVEYCAEECHRWLIADLGREVVADVFLSTTGVKHRIRYQVDWIYSEPCPQGRLQFARAIVGTRESSAFSPVLIKSGFCPRVTLVDVAADSPYFASENWNELVVDTLGADLLMRSDYERQIVPAIRRIIASDSPHRWTTFGLLVAVSSNTNADLLIADIQELFADVAPSSRQESRDGGSSKASNVRRIADAIDRHPAIVNALLDDLDLNPSLASNPGYRRLLDNLAGISSAVPTWGGPPVCANVDRIARYLPWNGEAKADATFLATLSRCDTGSENLVRRSLSDSRSIVVATALRVWATAAASQKAASRTLLPNVIEFLETKPLPQTSALPVYLYGKYASGQVRDGSATEDIARGLSALDELFHAIERLEAAGQTELKRALTSGAERAIQRFGR